MRGPFSTKRERPPPTREARSAWSSGCADGTAPGYLLFAGASTGGTRGKRVGRVGDVPLVGCGIYADNEGAAVCCTGWGEAFVRMAAAKAVSDRAARGEEAQAAVESVLHAILRRTEGRGGIIAIDSQGRLGAAFTTPDMGYRRAVVPPANDHSAHPTLNVVRAGVNWRVRMADAADAGRAKVLNS